MQMSNDGHAPSSVLLGKSVVKKSGKRKTPHISIKQLDKMRPPATVKSKKGEKILARHGGPMQNLLVPENNGASHTKNAIPMTSQEILYRESTDFI